MYHGTQNLNSSSNHAAYLYKSQIIFISLLNVTSILAEGWDYSLRFSGNKFDYVRIYNIRNLKDIFVSWWMKVPPFRGQSSVFSLVASSSGRLSTLLAFCIQAGGIYNITLDNDERYCKQ